MVGRSKSLLDSNARPGPPEPGASADYAITIQPDRSSGADQGFRATLITSGGSLASATAQPAYKSAQLRPPRGIEQDMRQEKLRVAAQELARYAQG